MKKREERTLEKMCDYLKRKERLKTIGCIIGEFSVLIAGLLGCAYYIVLCLTAF